MSPPPGPTPYLPLTVLDRAIAQARREADAYTFFYGAHDLRDEFQSRFVERAWQAWRAWRPDGGKSWRNWLQDYLRLGIRDVFRDKTQRRKAKAEFLKKYQIISLSDLVGEAGRGGEPGHVLDDVASQEPTSQHLEAECERGELVRQVLALLRPRERFIVEQHYLRGVRKTEIAAHLGITPHHLRRVELEAFARIREILAPDWMDGPEDQDAARPHPSGP